MGEAIREKKNPWRGLFHQGLLARNRQRYGSPQERSGCVPAEPYPLLGKLFMHWKPGHFSAPEVKELYSRPFGGVLSLYGLNRLPEEEGSLVGGVG